MLKGVRKFWRRITDGLALGQLWNQFHTDARTSYRLYSQEIDSRRMPGTGRVRHLFRMIKLFLWAIVDKLSPARRVILLIALILFFPHMHLTGFSTNGIFWGCVLLFLLLVMEISDRVVMKRDLQIAKEIQAWLLPPGPPQVPGLEIAFATRPANTVAGDYYDVFPRPASHSPGGTYLIAIADVAGKSMPAAMLMATYQASLKTLAGVSSSLIDLAGRMNNYACGNSENGRRFTTTFIAEYDPATRGLVYVNAGHDLPILRRQSGAIERLTAGGIPLGIQENTRYESGSTTLQSGDWLVIFTDGVTEAENMRQEEYGEVRFMVLLFANQTVTPSVLLNTILADIEHFVGNTPQHDDITLMLLKAV
ncbi:MAG TPA: PP2C family protein-serine/threonine phosphatase [Terracidiphilus sp.]|jgi:sigma-B regulation protein RsbU (phosphoserine phosphatase)